MSMKQYSSMSKAKLIKKIMIALKKLPKKNLSLMCYELEKSRLPTISTTKKGMPRLTARRAYTPVGSMAERKMRQRQAKRIMLKRKKPRSAKQRANDKRLGLMAKRRAKAKRRRR